MSEHLVYTIDLNTYHAMRELEKFHKWLRQNGVEYDKTFRVEYHKSMEKLWVSSYLIDDNGKFYLSEERTEAVWKLWSVPVVVPPGRILLEDMAQAVELIHGD